MQVPVISLLQPFAQLVVMGAKKIETRSWKTEFRGELYIHASIGKYYGPNKLSCRELCYTPLFRQFINGGLAYDKLPFGSIIGKVKLIDVINLDLYSGMIENQMSCFIGSNKVDFSIQELAFGDYSAGRYGWLFSEPKLFVYPIPARGKQGFWNFDMPEYFQYPNADGTNMVFSSPPTKEAIAAVARVAEKAKHYPTPHFWNDLYTDGTGNTFSDADPGL